MRSYQTQHFATIREVESVVVMVLCHDHSDQSLVAEVVVVYTYVVAAKSIPIRCTGHCCAGAQSSC